MYYYECKSLSIKRTGQQVLDRAWRLSDGSVTKMVSAPQGVVRSLRQDRRPASPELWWGEQSIQLSPRLLGVGPTQPGLTALQWIPTHDKIFRTTETVYLSIFGICYSKKKKKFEDIVISANISWKPITCKISLWMLSSHSEFNGPYRQPEFYSSEADLSFEN